MIRSRHVLSMNNYFEGLKVFTDSCSCQKIGGDVVGLEIADLPEMRSFEMRYFGMKLVILREAPAAFSIGSYKRYRQICESVYYFRNSTFFASRLGCVV